MAGTVTLSLQQIFDNVTREFLDGGKLFFFQSGTTTPQNAFTSAALTTPYANPLTLESDARVPFLWFADGTIRIRCINADGVIQFDFDNLQVMGDSGGGGGVDTTDPNAIAQTGDMKFRPATATISGWVRANGRTIGSATSGANERANADAENLFLHLWNSFSDSICPVVTGRGANAAADWVANKQITIIDMRGRGPAGVDDMGNSAASRITSATITNPTTGGSSGGAQEHTLTSGQMPTHTHTASTVSNGAHTHADLPGYGPRNGVSAGAGGTAVTAITTDASGGSGDVATSSEGAHTHTVTVDNAGSGSAHNNVQPTLLGAWFIRL